jgi:hypothetical protein
VEIPAQNGNDLIVEFKFQGVMIIHVSANACDARAVSVRACSCLCMCEKHETSALSESFRNLVLDSSRGIGAPNYRQKPNKW